MYDVLTTAGTYSDVATNMARLTALVLAQLCAAFVRPPNQRCLPLTPRRAGFDDDPFELSLIHI